MACYSVSKIVKLVISVLLLVLSILSLTANGKTISQTDRIVGKNGKEEWAYVKLRPNAHMFYWLYYTTATEGFKHSPLVMWLQGGPGSSSTGFGNFEEIGPLDVSLNPRNTTWLSVASLLFVDNPVGTGYSYVDDPSAYATNVKMIAYDLLALMKGFMKNVPTEFQSVPFYIFSESYGGKMTAAFSKVLSQAIKNGEINCNFQGFAMGDSWISPLDSVLTWGSYLYGASLLDGAGLEAVNQATSLVKEAIAQEDWMKATQEWGNSESAVETATGGVNFYNILKWSRSETNTKPTNHSVWDILFQRHVGYFQQPSLSTLMNGPIREKLKIIPKNVTWGGQSGQVFSNQRKEFMKDVVHIVDDLILQTNLSVVVYSGQLDLIVDTLGTESWVSTLKIFPQYYKAPRKLIRDSLTKQAEAYVKMYKNFSFYWILNSGHMVPQDNGNAALAMLRMVVKKQ